MTLFGFYSEEERFCFEQLQTVPGIGARQALRILSGITVQNLIKSLDAQDVKTLAKVPGIGPKTAQKLVLQLRNVLVLEDDEAEPKAETPSQFRDLIDSLAEMGFERKQIVRTLSEVMSENSLIIQGKDAREAESFLFPLFHSRSARGGNVTGFASEEVDNLLNLARAATGDSERMSALEQADELVAADAPVIPLTHPLQVIAAGETADGLIIEVHNDPANALCDGAQSLKPEKYDRLLREVSQIAQVVGKQV